MKRHVIYFVDEDAAARHANVRDLTTLLDNPEIKVIQQEPLKNFADYNPLMANPATAAFILDQRMKPGGMVSYNGTDLAGYLRGIDGKMPIYILTGHADQPQDFTGFRHLVEYVIDKENIENANSEEAKIVKARLLRHLEVFNDVRNAQEQRFHDLLIKSLREPLTNKEQIEMDQIEGETTAPIQAAERKKEQELGETVDQLRRLLDGGQLPM
jgi:FixJ family two-component response regulator